VCDTSTMVFVAEAFGAWLLERAAGAGSKRLAESVLGGEQQRALRQAATAAIQRTAEDLHPEGGEQAAHLMMVVDHVFSEPVPRALLGERTTVVQALQVGVAEQLAVLGDASMTGVGTSSADLLGVRVAQLVQTLTRNLLHEILVSGGGWGSVDAAGRSTKPRHSSPAEPGAKRHAGATGRRRP
jgi:hypothetical protein